MRSVVTGLKVAAVIANVAELDEATRKQHGSLGHNLLFFCALTNVQEAMAKYGQLGETPQARVDAEGSLDSVRSLRDKVKELEKCMADCKDSVPLVDSAAFQSLVEQCDKHIEDHRLAYTAAAAGPLSIELGALKFKSGGAPEGRLWTEEQAIKDLGKSPTFTSLRAASKTTLQAVPDVEITALIRSTALVPFPKCCFSSPLHTT